jgi:hypothetical protein
MSTTANSLASIAAEAASPDTLPSLSRDSTALANGELGMDDGADLGGHGLLSRPALPQGRRSLFRR